MPDKSDFRKFIAPSAPRIPQQTKGLDIRNAQYAAERNGIKVGFYRGAAAVFDIFDQAKSPAPFCAYCGADLSGLGDPKVHVKVCEQGPYVEQARELDDMLVRLDNATKGEREQMRAALVLRKQLKELQRMLASVRKLVAADDFVSVRVLLQKVVAK